MALATYAPYAFVRQALGGKKTGDWRGRMGRVRVAVPAGGIWIHAVSVGEVSAARSILHAIRETAEPGPLVISASTAAGLERARAAPEADAAVAFPFDLKRPVQRALLALAPSLVLLTETEIWPLFLEECAARAIPVALVNGRLSDGSFSRYLRARSLLKRPLNRISLFLMQSEEDARRIRELGAAPERVRTTGNVKFDLTPPHNPELTQTLRGWAAGRKVFLAGSTHEGEEEAVLEAWRRLDPRPLLILAPRRPERFDTVSQLASRYGQSLRRSRGANAADIVVLDTVGELAAAYETADIAFLGASLINGGGHNPIEAWACGVPVLMGPHTQNFRAVTEVGRQAGALETVAGAEDLAGAAQRLLADDGERRRRADGARELVRRNVGAAARTAAAVAPLRKRR